MTECDARRSVLVIEWVGIPLAVAAIAWLVVAGCGSGRRDGTARVNGTITIDGKPLPADAQASITFVPASKGRSAGAEVVDGAYDCADVPVGKVKVYLSVLRPTGRMLTESDNKPFPEVASIIASKYQAGVEIEIKGDGERQDFDLEPAEQ